MSYGGEQGVGGDFKKIVRRTEVVWMFKRKREEGGIAQKGRSTTKQHVGRSSKKYSKKGRKQKKHQKNVHNVKGSMAKYRSRKDRYS